MKKKVEDVLLELGITPNLVGFNYICTAIDILQEESENLKAVGMLYSDIAEKYKTNKFSVERAIRFCLAKIDRDGEAFRKYIGINGTTNSEILCTMAVRLKN